MPNQVVIEDAAVPGDPNSYYSEEITLVAEAYTTRRIPEGGWIPWEAGRDAYLPVRWQLTVSPPTTAILTAAQAGGMVWSDGTNLVVNNAGTQVNAKYFVLAHKP